MSAATGEAPNVNDQKIETPNAKETLFERVSAPFDLEDIVEDIIANAPVVIDDSSNNNGDSAFSNVPLVQENFENPIVSHNQVLDLKSVPSTTTVDATAIMYNPKEINSPTTEPEKLNQVDDNNDFDILQYRDSWNESLQIDMENNVTDDMLFNAIVDDVDPNFFNDFKFLPLLKKIKVPRYQHFVYKDFLNHYFRFTKSHIQNFCKHSTL